MKKKTITVLEIIYGLLLKFGKIDEASVNVLVQQLGKKFNIEIDEENKYYFVTEDGFIILNPVSIDLILKKINNKQLENSQSELVINYLNNISLAELVLRKIKLYGWVSLEKDSLMDVFSISEIIELRKLIKDGYIIDYFEEALIYDDYYAAQLTKKGEVKLFVVDNASKINSFFNSLGIESGEMDRVKEDFLMTQNLGLEIRKILNIDNYVSFCRIYDREYPKNYSLLRTPKKQ